MQNIKNEKNKDLISACGAGGPTKCWQDHGVYLSYRSLGIFGRVGSCRCIQSTLMYVTMWICTILI